MSLEQAIQENTAAIRDLIAVQSGKPAATVDAGTTSGKPAAKAKPGAKAKPTSKYSAEQLKAVLIKYKDLTDLKKAKALTKELGYDSITDVPVEEIDTVYAGIEEAIEALEAGDGSDGDDEAL